MKRFVALRDGEARPLGWVGDDHSGILHQGEERLEARSCGAGDDLTLRLGDRVFRVERLGGHRWRVNGREVESRVLTELEHRFAGFGAGEDDEAAHRLEVPMPGKVVRVLVAPGDEVAKGQGVVIVEAMKMENELKAPRAARVAAVHVQEGQGVEKGTLLVEFA
jgi:biotin carboxyl carrier protein